MDLDLKILEHFTGTQNYYNVFGIHVTDGVRYIMENGYSWFVTDAIAVILTELRNYSFLVVKLDKENKKMVITDGDDNILYEQKYKWTDARRDLKLFYSDGVLMLNTEY